MATGEIARIQDQLQRAYAGDAWHGPDLCKLLTGVSAERAAAKPIAGAHGIWTLVLHINTWQRFATRALRGERNYKPAPEEDFPGVTDPSEAAWQKVRQELESAHHGLKEAIGTFAEERLNERVPGLPDTFYVLLHGVIQHNLYHAGQIALLKKA